MYLNERSIVLIVFGLFMCVVVYIHGMLEHIRGIDDSKSIMPHQSDLASAGEKKPEKARLRTRTPENPNVVKYKDIPFHVSTGRKKKKIKTESIFMTCMVNGKEIKLTQDKINDDFCDCTEDGKDELNTSACTYFVHAAPKALEKSTAIGQFDCLDKIKKLIPHSKVDDGVCDCCSGNDERLGCQGSKELKAKCVEEEAFAMKQEEKIKKGRELYQSYYQPEGQKLMNTNDERYKIPGNPPIGILGLSALSKCFNLNDGEFNYEFCPFKSATQSSQTSIGRSPSWDADSNTIIMQNGDSCPNRVKRKFVVEFVCSDENELTRILETQTCVYKGYFNTPAVCST